MPKSGLLALKLESDRMVYLDLLRTAASYSIIVYHFQNQMDLGSAKTQVHHALDGLTLAVDLFFFISGFVISSVYVGRLTNVQDYRDFIVKRVARLGPLHWVTFFVFVLLGILHAIGKLPSNHPEIYDPRCAVPNLLLIHAFGLCGSLTFNYVSWSISAEMGMYAIAPLLLVIAARRAPSLLVAAALLAVLAVSSGGGWLDWSFNGGVARALPSFLLGMIAFNWRAGLARLPGAARWLGLACCVFLLACGLQCPKLILLPLAYVIGLLGVAASEQPVSRLARRFAPLGQLTYSLYMLHPIVQAVLLTGVGASLLKLHGIAINLFVAGMAVAMIPIAWLSLALFERPARRWLTRTLGARPAPRKSELFTPDSRW